MTALASVRRRNTWLALSAGLVALAVVPVAAVVAGSAITSSSAAVNVGDETVLEIPPTPVGALAMVDGAGALVSITAFAVAPAGAGGTVLSVPVGARVRVSGVEAATMEAIGGVRLADVYRAEGPEVFHRELSGLLNTSLAFVEVLSSDRTGELLTTAGMPGELVDRVLTASLADTAVAEQQRWGGVAEAWAAVAGAFPGSPVTSVSATTPVPTPPDDLAGVVAAVFDGPVAYHQFAVTPVLTSEANPNGLDLYDVDRSEVVLVMASVAPSAVVAANPSVAVQVDSSFDFPVTKRAVGSLLFVGANVLLVRQVDDPPPAATQLRTSVRLSPQDIEAFETLFGVIEVSEAQQRVEGIDVQIRLGTAFAAAEDDQ